MTLGAIFEAMMLIIFGASWPAQIIKTVRVKNPVGKSFVFQYLVIAGYWCGVASKFAKNELNWVLALYFLDIILVSTDVILSHYYLAKIRKAEKAK